MSNLKLLTNVQDTSGTAKAVVASLNDLGLNFDVAEIELIREPQKQVRGLVSSD
jgi:hypothetical protein